MIKWHVLYQHARLGCRNCSATSSDDYHAGHASNVYTHSQKHACCQLSTAALCVCWPIVARVCVSAACAASLPLRPAPVASFTAPPLSSFLPFPFLRMIVFCPAAFSRHWRHVWHAAGLLARRVLGALPPVLVCCCNAASVSAVSEDL